MIRKLLRCLSIISCSGLVACKEPVIKNIQTDGDNRFLLMQCPPYGNLRFMIDDGEALAEDWTTEKTECINWIQDNWNELWPIVEDKFDEMASRYAYGEQKLEPHIINIKNTLCICPNDKDHWSISLSIIKERPGSKRKPGSHSLCIDMERDKVLEYQPVY